MKKYVDISGFNINLPNRGSAALGYGSIFFLKEKGYLRKGQELIYFRCFINFFKRENLKTSTEHFVIDGEQFTRNVVPMFILEKYLAEKFGVYLPFTPFGKAIKDVDYEAAFYGGDGFSDIYGERTFLHRMNQTFILWKRKIPLIMLPQTIGPFSKKKNYDIAVQILRYANDIYVRDSKFTQDLDRLGLKYVLTKDLSSFMKPDPWDIDIKPNAIGLNVSGLAYSNSFCGLEGQFDVYPELIERIINHFKEKGCQVYLIPHSYGYSKPIVDDDMIACRQAYERLADKNNVVLVDKDLSAPQVKYVISKMTFFIGARMHANFAAIYTGVPVFGTAYSYKFEGAFNANGLDGKKQTAMLNNLKREEIDAYIAKIDTFYNEAVK